MENKFTIKESKLKNWVKSPSRKSENKIKKPKNKSKGPESWRIKKYIKNVEKFNYPGSSLSIHGNDSKQFMTIDNKKIKQIKEAVSIKSGEYQMDANNSLKNWVSSDSNKNYKTFLKIKRKSLNPDTSQVKKIDKVYKVKHNNSKKRNNSKKKVKNGEPKYSISSYAGTLKDSSNYQSKKKGLSSRDQAIKFTKIFDINSIKHKTRKVSKENRKKSTEPEKKYLKKLKFKKKDTEKNSTFDFTKFKKHVEKQKMRPISRSKSREKQKNKFEDQIDVSPIKDIDIEIAALSKRSKAIK